MTWGRVLGEQLLRVSELEEQLAAGGHVLIAPPVRAAPTADLLAEVKTLRDTLGEANATIARQDHRILELRRSVDEARAENNMWSQSAAKLEKRLSEERAERERVEVELAEAMSVAAAPVIDPGPCPVCHAIKLMVLGVEPVPVRAKPPANQRTPGAAVGVIDKIREVLRAASTPLLGSEIAERIGISSTKVITNIPHLRRRNEVRRTGERGSYRYELERGDGNDAHLGN